MLTTFWIAVVAVILFVVYDRWALSRHVAKSIKDIQNIISLSISAANTDHPMNETERRLIFSHFSWPGWAKDYIESFKAPPLAPEQATVLLPNFDEGGIQYFFEQILSIMCADGNLNDPELDWLHRFHVATKMDETAYLMTMGFYFGRELSSQCEGWTKVLNVPLDSSIEVIKRAYRTKANEFHPDKLVGVSEGVKNLAEEKLKEINRAYENLIGFERLVDSRVYVVVDANGTWTKLPELETGGASKSRQIQAYSGNDVSSFKLICESAKTIDLVLFIFTTNDERVWECARDECISSPNIFLQFDITNPLWIKLLSRVVAHNSIVLQKIKNADDILFALLASAATVTGEHSELLCFFANAGIADLSAYPNRKEIWHVLPSRCRFLFVLSTARGWLTNFFKNSSNTNRPEQMLLEAIYGTELRGQHFNSESPKLIEAGLKLFNLLHDAPEEMFEEWLINVAMGKQQLSTDQIDEILRIVELKNAKKIPKTIYSVALESQRADFQSMWGIYWKKLPVQERMFFRLENLFHSAPSSHLNHALSKRDNVNTKVTDSTIALFITALGLEFMAVRAHLTSIRERTIDNVVYALGLFQANGTQYTVAIAQTGPGNVEAATLTERAIKDWSPKYVFFVGIAGALKAELDLGDVVAAEKVYAYESGKAEKEFKPRPKSPLTPFASLQRAHATSRNKDWVKRIKNSPILEPDSYVKPIAAGEKVIDSHESGAFQLIKAVYSDAYAVAMEEFGFYYALHANPQVTGAVIRGISDFSEDKAEAEKEKSQEVASAHASAFAFEMLAGFLSADLDNTAEKLDYRHL